MPVSLPNTRPATPAAGDATCARTPPPSSSSLSRRRWFRFRLLANVVRFSPSATHFASADTSSDLWWRFVAAFARLPTRRCRSRTVSIAPTEVPVRMEANASMRHIRTYWWRGNPFPEIGTVRTSPAAIVSPPPPRYARRRVGGRWVECGARPACSANFPRGACTYSSTSDASFTIQTDETEVCHPFVTAGVSHFRSSCATRPLRTLRVIDVRGDRAGHRLVPLRMSRW